MKLDQLIARLADAEIPGSLATVEVSEVTEDSREAGPGVVFCAIRGMRSDGHDFVAQAASAGAAAVVVERAPGAELGVPVIVVPDGKRAFGILAAALAGDPGEALTLIGITGTNGKTTTSYLIEAVLKAADEPVGVIGTVSYRYPGAELPAPYTTPTPAILHRQLGQFREVGCSHAVLETSSAALAMGRLEGTRFSVGVFTNLSQDHLDLHGSMEAYRAAKARLFSDHLRADGVAVIVTDDPAADDMIRAAGDHRVLRVSTEAESDAEVRVLEYQSTVAGIRARIHTPRGEIQVGSRALLGEYNVVNLATVVAVGEALGLDHADIARGLEDMAGVPGRVERVENDHQLDILVDYAHTPDALANVLEALRPLAERRLICVFGCGGDRDPSKRPLMGAEVSAVADLAVVTSDNPRTEEPQAIIDMILPAVPDPFFVHTDRRAAIAAAVAEATPGDIVLIAGKGHEDYQILGTEKVHFDDREEAAAAAAARPVWSAGQIAEETGGELVHGARGTRITRILIDGRSAAPGDLYVAIVGERFDGHDFVSQAAAAGARAVLVRRGYFSLASADPAVALPDELAVIEVEDPREALGELARHHRGRYQGVVVGVTGSSGKTTVKDMAAAALSPLGPVHRPRGSLNNETGVPLTLLGLRRHHRAAVIEMGMRGLGHIDVLGQMVQPDVGVVINAQKAHIGVVGSADAIARGKSEMFGRIRRGGAAIAPAGDPRLLEPARSADRQITFGRDGEGIEFRADVEVVASAPAPEHGRGAQTVTLRYQGREATGVIPVAGDHNADNAACAVAIAVAAGVAFEDAAAALQQTRPSAMRGQIESIGDRSVLVDCYNANPASMAAALTTLAGLAGPAPAIAVLGDMLELGESAEAEHRQVGQQAGELGVRVIAVGEHAGAVAEASGGEAVTDVEAAARRAWELSAAGTWILIKASRGLRLERVAETLRQLAGGAG